MNTPVSIPSTERWRLRASDFELLHEAGALADVRKAELIDGDIYGMSPQMARHARVKTRLAFAIAARLKAIGAELDVIIEVSVVVADDSVLEPDIVVSSYRGIGFVPANTVALVVEIADSTVSRDLGRKAVLYAAAGIQEYWVVNVNGRCTQCHTLPGADGYQGQQAVPFGQPLCSSAINGLSVATAGLLD